MSFTIDGLRLDADLDIFNPNLKDGYVIGLVLHAVGEVLMNKIFRKRTNPKAVAKKSHWQCVCK
jgi:hypothetical protein